MRRRILQAVRSVGSGLLDESGQVIAVTVTFFLFILLAATALGIDTGALHSSRERLQQVADAAAIAGARDLAPPATTSGSCNPLTGPLPTPGTPGGDACANVKTNLSGSSFTNVSASWTNYKGDTSQIEVTVSATWHNFFARTIPGLSTTGVSARAAAKITAAVAGVPYALFAGDTNCSNPGVSIDKNNNVIGSVHSNGTLSINGNNGNIGSASYGGPNHCSGPSSSDVQGPLTTDWNTEPYPVTFGLPGSQSTICAGAGVHNGTNFTIDSSSDGVYCATNTITVSGDTTATVTLIAPTVSIGGPPATPSR